MRSVAGRAAARLHRPRASARGSSFNWAFGGVALAAARRAPRSPRRRYVALGQDRGGRGPRPATPFSEAALAQARARGKPVFLYFTADWCLTCKVNEANAIDRDEVRKAFDKAGVVTMVGDWTNCDPAITPLPRGAGPLGRAALSLLSARRDAAAGAAAGADARHADGLVQG